MPSCGMRQSKRKKRPKGSKKGIAENQGEVAVEKEHKALDDLLLKSFASVSMGADTAVYGNSHGCPTKAADALSNRSVLEDQSTTCSSSSGTCDVGSSSSSNMSDVFGDTNNFCQDGFGQKSKPKTRRVVASAGTVSTVLGKDYVRSIPKKGSSKLKGFHDESWSKEEAEQFLYSMLGDDSELSLAVVIDILCECNYNLDKALDILLELSSSSRDQARNDYESASTSSEFTQKSNDSLIDRIIDSTSHSSNRDSQDSMWLTGNLCRKLSEVPESNNFLVSTEIGNSKSEIPQKVLESLFNMPTPKTAEHEPGTMNWRNVVKKIASLSQGFEPAEVEPEKPIYAKGEEYQVIRESAKEHWGAMKSYYQKAATAFSNGEKQYATYLSDQGRLQNIKAREADEKASQHIFASRNRSIENVITIDLHGQHVKQAMKLLKLHLLFGACVRSVSSFRVITGCGSHGSGKSTLKNSVINLLGKEGIWWSEENRGTLFIKLQGQTNFSFLDTGSDSD